MMNMDEEAVLTSTNFELPGFRFHPTEEELIDFYLKNMVFRNKLDYHVIGVLNIYRHEPWDLPGLAKIGEREWYFFVPRDRKHGNGGRPNRTTEHGFWKATGSDRKIVSLSAHKRVLGLRKTLVFYQGRAPRGRKTDWVMNEYRLPDNCSAPKDIVLCKIYRKATSLKVLEQWAAIEEKQHQLMKPVQTAVTEEETLLIDAPAPAPAPAPNYYSSYPSSPLSSNSAASHHYSYRNEDFTPQILPTPIIKNPLQQASKQQESADKFIGEGGNNHNNNYYFEDEIVEENKVVFPNVNDDDDTTTLPTLPAPTTPTSSSTTIQLPLGHASIPQLQVPKLVGMDWTQDSFWSQLCSPWLDNFLLTPTPNYANILI